jgi:hypothetical protein
MYAASTNGSRTRNRTCDNPVPGAGAGEIVHGHNCTGNYFETIESGEIKHLFLQSHNMLILTVLVVTLLNTNTSALPSWGVDMATSRGNHCLQHSQGSQYNV